MMSSYDAWVTREPYGYPDIPEDCIYCGKPLAYNNTCGVCFRKKCRAEMRADTRAERDYEDALAREYNDAE
jgi:hypothetical protein